MDVVPSSYEMEFKYGQQEINRIFCDEAFLFTVKRF